MNYSEIKKEVYNYLGYSGEEGMFDIDRTAEECLSELDSDDAFSIVYAEYDSPLPFMKEGAYESFLKDCDGYFLTASTLGANTDRKIRQISVSDMARATVFDSVASAYLEKRTEEFKKELSPTLSYTFCPGYQGTCVDDLKIIFRELMPERIGMTLTPSNMILPQKSIVGITAKKFLPKPSCDKCKNRNECLKGKSICNEE